MDTVQSLFGPLLHGFFGFLVQALGSVITIAIPALVTMEFKKYGIAKTAQTDAITQNAVDLLNAAVQRAGGIAYNSVIASGGLTALSKNTALAAGLKHINESLPIALTLLASKGVTQDGIINMIDGELGKLFAVDPTVSAVPTPATPTSSATATGASS